MRRPLRLTEHEVQVIFRLQNAGFGYLLHEHVLRMAKKRERERLQQ